MLQQGRGNKDRLGLRLDLMLASIEFKLDRDLEFGSMLLCLHYAHSMSITLCPAPCPPGHPLVTLEWCAISARGWDRLDLCIRLPS